MRNLKKLVLKYYIKIAYKIYRKSNRKTLYGSSKKDSDAFLYVDKKFKEICGKIINLDDDSMSDCIPW